MDISKLQASIETLNQKIKAQESSVPNTSDSFGNMLKNAINEVDDLHSKADDSIKALAAGKEADIHNTMIAMEKASISFQLMMQVRNKAVEAYQEVMRMQV